MIDRLGGWLMRTGLTALSRRSLVVAISVAALAAAATRADQDLAIRVNDVDGAPGEVVEVVLRSYAPRSIGQGQLEIRAAPRPRSLARPTVRAAVESPFVALESFQLFSQAGDHSGSASLAFDGAALVAFQSPTASINRSDGPIAVLRLRLASDLAVDDEYELDLDLGVSHLVGEHGEAIPIDPRPGRLRIREADGTPTPDAGAVGFDKNNLDLPESVGFALVAVERRGGAQGAISVSYRTVDGTAKAGDDYLAASGVLSWGSGESGARAFVVELLDDGVVETAETLRLELSAPTGGAVLDAGSASVELAISDDDHAAPPSAGVIGFDQRGFLASEDAGVAIITVVRAGGLDGAVSVAFETSAGSADAGDDYEDVSGTLDWAAGQGGARSFVVPLVRDSLAEPTETARVLLFAPGGGAALDPVNGDAVMSILDSPPPPPLAGAGEIGLVRDEVAVIESAGQATVGVARDGGVAGVVSVHYRVDDGAAIAGLDYGAVAGVVSWGDGEGGVKTFAVPILDDAFDEGNEHGQLELSQPSGGASIRSDGRSGLLLVIDDDAPRDPCVADADTLCLTGGRFRVEARFRSAAGSTGAAHAVPESDHSGLLWFFQPSNMEVLVKVLDACALPAFESYWVFFSATTNVDFTLVVTDTTSGLTREYSNPLGHAAEPVQDTTTFKVCQ